MKIKKLSLTCTSIYRLASAGGKRTVKVVPFSSELSRCSRIRCCMCFVSLGSLLVVLVDLGLFLIDFLMVMFNSVGMILCTTLVMYGE